MSRAAATAGVDAEIVLSGCSTKSWAGRFPRDAAVAAPAPRLSVNSATWHEVPRWG